jgi:two-component system NtrC family sensor kinase
LSAAVAHEINNPLAGIFTYARLLEKKLAPAKPILDWIHTIQHESKRCGEIVNNLLVFARKHHTELSRIEVKTIVHRTLAVVQHNLDMHGIALSCQIAEAPPLYCDASQIQQVLLAIIMNAVDAMSSSEPKGGVLELQAAPAAEGRIDISLTNNGPPIPKDVLPHIFEPFFSTKQAASGVGLGLAVAYGIVKRHGGEIRAETGAKTTFHVLLPLDGPAYEQHITEKLDVPGETVHSNSR